MIQKLPNENLARVVEIIQRGRPTGNTCGEENFVDLEKEQDAVGHYSHSCDPPDKDKVCDTPPNSELDPDNEEIMSLDLIVEPQSTSSA
ncbi:hypothetical protein V6N13_110870 [Hibiscus sabdariffa]